ncbi:MAG: adenosylmethionine--8-amino-7-oxononanoate transaminase [Alphaproteobacteria bacterium]|nr:adenosylmethionine--8-amino-7-oxononanoate transaminase [Alphaproteobacteria bacterium]
MNDIPIIWHPFTQHGLAGPAVKIERAEGVYLYTKDGRKIIDAISSWWVNTHGHCHPEIVRAVQEQAGKLEQVIFAGFTHAPAEELAEKLLSFTDFGHSHVFFSDSGSTAVEVALKMAVGYWAHTGRPRKKIVALEGGYHGDTVGAMSAGGRSVFNKLYEPYLFEVAHLPFEDMENAFEKILRKEGDDIAALIVEPLIQGAGGMRTYPAETLKNLAGLCKKYDVLLIADEVMTGFGRTGTKFACEQANVTPDILCLSKGLTGGFLPMGATLCTAEIYNAFYSKDRAKMFFHSSSYTGNALSCAAALANLRVWEKELVMERIAAIEKSHESAAARLEKQGARNVRHKGTILAVDFENGKEGYLSAFGPRLHDFFMERDILLRPLGNTVYIMPPYCITQEELERIYDVIGLALEHFRDGSKQQAV